MSPFSPHEDHRATRIAIVGGGPRGISVIERIGALLSSRPDRTPLEINVIDPCQIGAGTVWRTDQTRTVRMNTLAGAVTMFTEPGATVSAPVRPGPTLYEWVEMLRHNGTLVNPSHIATFEAHPVNEEVRWTFAEELVSTRIDSNPSRALYGAYLRWCYQVAQTGLPDFVKLVEHRERVVSIDDELDGTDRITLSDGTFITTHATVLATGWVQPGANDEEQELADAIKNSAAELMWIRPGNPIDQDLSSVPDGGDVLVRGLGMGFFDLTALLTIDRGGRFVADPAARSGLRYEASGREPHLKVASGRGYPFLPKSEYGDLPPASPLRRLTAVVAELSATDGPIDVGTQVWPAIARDAHEAYYRAIARARPRQVHAPISEIIRILDATEVPPVIGTELDDALTGVVDPELLFNLPSIAHPLAGITGTPEELLRHIADGVAKDLAHAHYAYDSPLKEGLWAIASCRKPLAILCQGGRATVESRLGIYAQIMALGQMVGSGPPSFRSRELLALIDAGLVTFIGSQPKLSVEDGTFCIRSATTEDTPFRSTTLIDAWMHSPDIRRPAHRDLTASLGPRIRPFVWSHASAADTGPFTTGSPEVEPVSRRLVGENGEPDKRVHLVGIPTHSQMADTTISPMPGTDPLMLRETDAAAVSAVSVAMRTAAE